MMANTTGKKFGGRKKGTSNKDTSKLREAFTNLLNDNLEQIKLDLEELEPKDRVKLMLDLASFVIPKVKAMDIDITSKGDRININPINWVETE